MKRSFRTLALLAAVAALAGCPFPPGLPGGDAGTDAGTGNSDGGGASDAGWGQPITAPNETWTFVAFPEARCGNGISTGIAVNLTTRSKDVVLYLQGGGACWDPSTCYVLRTTAHFEDTMDEAAVLAEARQANYLFDRARADNPFRNASFVYVPYCTGDLHGGTAPHTYSALGQTRTGHHVGALNVAAYLSRLAPTFSGATRVWLAGASAGGFGAVINWWRVQQAFGGVRVDVLDDSGTFVEPVAGRFEQMRDAWSLQLPPGCSACDAGFSNFLPHYAQAPGSGRLALLSTTQDGVIAAYFGISGPEFEQRLAALRAAMAGEQRSYVTAGTQHVLLGQNPFPRADGGVALTDWLAQFASGDGGWSSQGP
jgi:Pectinacetylesterase